MELTEITKGIALVCEFMDYRIEDGGVYLPPGFDPSGTERNGMWYCFEEIDPEWNLLMPAYKKIVTNELYEGTDNDGVCLFNVLYDRVGDADDIDEVFELLVEFINWYNEHKKSK